MKWRCSVLLALGLLSSAFCQELRRIAAKEAAQHLLHTEDPVYPPIAKIAHIQGDVLIDATISKTGSVSSVRGFSGHPVLFQSALIAAKQWQYQPFVLQGKAVPVSVRVLFRFSMDIAEKQPAVYQYYQQEILCLEDLSAKLVPEATVTCAEAALSAEALPPERLKERLHGNAFAGDALSLGERFGDAVSYYQRAMVVGESASSSGAKWYDPVATEMYVHAANALESTGDLEGANSSYTQAENVLTKAANTRQPDGSNSPDGRSSLGLRVQLKGVFERHIALLQQMGRTALAGDLQNRANAIQLEDRP